MIFDVRSGLVDMVLDDSWEGNKYFVSQLLVLESRLDKVFRSLRDGKGFGSFGIDVAFESGF